MVSETSGNKILNPPSESLLDNEFEAYFHGTLPKILVTTCKKPSKKSLLFATELAGIFGNSSMVERKPRDDMDRVLSESIDHGYTDLLIVGQRNNSPSLLTLIHLPVGPTAHMRISSFRPSHTLSGRGVPTSHSPELVLNNFDTLLGMTVGKILMALFPQRPEFRGRQVVTFHNHRDFIFFRRHRYIFEQEGKDVRLQELGPRFCLRLDVLQKGAFNKTGETIWSRKRIPNTRKDLCL